MSLPANELARLAWSQLWQVTVLVMIVGALVRVACRRRPHLAYLLWMLVVVKCLTPPLWSSPAGVFSWAQRKVADATPTRASGPRGLPSPAPPAAPARLTSPQHATLSSEEASRASRAVSTGA